MLSLLVIQQLLFGGHPSSLCILLLMVSHVHEAERVGGGLDIA